jgi:putative membrane protein
MADFLAGAYPWIKALHVISVIAWMAGLLYLPRLFVYHADTPTGSPQSETFKVMERRLHRAIMTPAMAATWLFGLLLLSVPGIVSFSDGWVYAKLFLVLVMSAAHDRMGRWQRDFANDANQRPARFYRIVNEIPTLLMIGIVVLVIVKPF